MLCLFTTQALPKRTPPPVRKKIFTIVTDYRAPSGGTETLKKFLSRNMVYPKKAISKGIAGKTAVRFAVLYNKPRFRKVKILHKLDESISQELLRMVEIMPEWRFSGARAGYGSVLCTIHFNFEIQKRLLFRNKGIISTDAIEIIPLDRSPISTEEYFTTLEEKIDTLLKYREPHGKIMPLKEFLLEQTTYPETAISKGIEGRTAVQFTVSPTEIKQIEILNKLDDSINQELLRMFELMPKQGLLAIRGPYWYVKCIIHFNFEIQKNKNTGIVSIDFIEIVPLNLSSLYNIEKNE